MVASSAAVDRRARRGRCRNGSAPARRAWSRVDEHQRGAEQQRPRERPEGTSRKREVVVGRSPRPRSTSGSPRQRRQALDRGEQTRRLRWPARRGRRVAAEPRPRPPPPPASRRLAGRAAHLGRPGRGDVRAATPRVDLVDRPVRSSGAPTSASGPVSSSRNSSDVAHQLVDRPLVDDAPAVEHDDPVGQQQRGVAGARSGRSCVRRALVERAVDGLLGAGVDGRCGVVEDEHLGVGQRGAGQGDPLALAAGQREPALAHDGVVAVRAGRR